jgi:hypothetical protein
LDPRYAGANPAERVGLLRAKGFRNMSSFGGEVKPLANVVRFYGMLKIP